MSVRVEKITSITPLVGANTPMDVVITESGLKNIANRDNPDEPRDRVGDHVIVIPENYIVSEKLLKHNGLWDEEKNRGVLRGSKRNRTHVRMIAGQPSEVMLVRVTPLDDINLTIEDYDGNSICFESNEESIKNALGITEWVNPNK